MVQCQEAGCHVPVGGSVSVSVRLRVTQASPLSITQRFSFRRLYVSKYSWAGKLTSPLSHLCVAAAS